MFTGIQRTWIIFTTAVCMVNLVALPKNPRGQNQFSSHCKTLHVYSLMSWFVKHYLDIDSVPSNFGSIVQLLLMTVVTMICFVYHLTIMHSYWTTDQYAYGHYILLVSYNVTKDFEIPFVVVYWNYCGHLCKHQLIW